jgi:hypothetical protein
MVKNTKGGSKTKSIARKKQNQVKGSEMIYPDDKDQMLVEVFKVGNQYDYWTFDPKLFKANDDNKILWLATKRAGGEINVPGTIFLVAHRSCDTNNAKKRVDVLHVYSIEQKKNLEREGYLSFGTHNLDVCNSESNIIETLNLENIPDLPDEEIWDI